ncbi:MAG: prenyltransferase/squalene oxidase repeat-containing protein, partial [Cellulosilyticaceae bacterium]
MVTPQEIKNSIQKGLVWLSTHQNEDGSWGSSTYYPIGTTGLALLKLEGYAVENGISPFSNAYPYHQNVLKGLNYLFSVAKENVHGIYFEESGHINYEQGIVLAALTVGSDPNLIVNVPGSVADSKTYKQVADLMVQYLVYSQDPNGGWAYELGDIPDNSVSGYVILGLEIAENPEYNFNCIIPATLKSKLNNWIDFIQ